MVEYRPRVAILFPDDEPASGPGITVVVDVFRAFTNACHLIHGEPARYFVTDTVECAVRYKAQNPEAVLVGERAGRRLSEFDYGNSPTEVSAADFSGKTVVHTTSAGTKGVMVQHSDQEVITGSFANISAVAGFIRERESENVHIYCTRPSSFGIEDHRFAVYLKAVLTGSPPECYSRLIRDLRERSRHVFGKGGYAPYTDFLHCIDLDRFPFVIRKKGVLHTPAGRLVEMERLDLQEVFTDE